ncbi:DNA-entry nuclease [Bacillus sp. ILBB4]|nr:DNA-entry nuclease [Bacillus sp. ILBB4]
MGIPVEYDSCGRMKYHPEYHPNHGKEYTMDELIYICSTYGRGTRKEVALAVGRTEATVSQLVCLMRKEEFMNGISTFDHYKSLAETR